MKKLHFIWFLSLIVLCSCNITNRTSKYKYTDGFYKIKGLDWKSTKVYVQHYEDSVRLYYLYDSAKPSVLIEMPEETIVHAKHPNIFIRPAFDIDLITTPIKFRPAKAGVPTQINTTANASLYLGYRRDYYSLHYKKTPINTWEREVMHYGLSFGAFGGFGSAPLNQWVLSNHKHIEYEGVVFTKGVAAIFGVNHFTIGLAVGTDNLLDKNRRFWIYENRFWYGLSLGLNLN